MAELTSLPTVSLLLERVKNPLEASNLQYPPKKLSSKLIPRKFGLWMTVPSCGAGGAVAWIAKICREGCSRSRMSAGNKPVKRAWQKSTRNDPGDSMVCLVR